MIEGKGRQQAKSQISCLGGGILRHFIAQIAACWELLGKRGSIFWF